MFPQTMLRQNTKAIKLTKNIKIIYIIQLVFVEVRILTKIWFKIANMRGEERPKITKTTKCQKCELHLYHNVRNKFGKKTLQSYKRSLNNSKE